jgi:hypothetical protein
MTVTPKPKKHYVNNRELYSNIVAYQKACREARETGSPIPVMPDSIGIAFMSIATRRSSTKNFSGYFFRDEMILNAVEECIRRIHSFNPEKSQNPFTYFTTVASRVFLRQIKMEKALANFRSALFHSINILELPENLGCVDCVPSLMVVIRD